MVPRGLIRGGTGHEKIILSAMFTQTALLALLAITVSTFTLRIVIGYLLKPPRSRDGSRGFPTIGPRRIGRRAAMLLYGPKSRDQNK